MSHCQETSRQASGETLDTIGSAKSVVVSCLNVIHCEIIGSYLRTSAELDSQLATAEWQARRAEIVKKQGAKRIPVECQSEDISRFGDEVHAVVKLVIPLDQSPPDSSRAGLSTVGLLLEQYGRFMTQWTNFTKSIILDTRKRPLYLAHHCRVEAKEVFAGRFVWEAVQQQPRGEENTETILDNRSMRLEI